MEIEKTQQNLNKKGGSSLKGFWGDNNVMDQLQKWPANNKS